MAMINFAERAHNHNFGPDEIIRSVLDTDFYKLLMLQFIWKKYRNVRVRFGLTNRTKRVLLADGRISETDLRFQLDHVRKLKLTRSEEIWLRGNTFYGKKNIFDNEFIDWFRDYNLTPYKLSKENGQWILEFEGLWPEVSMWEIYALSIINELKTRAALKTMTKAELTFFYAQGMVIFWEKLEAFKALPNLRLADFGTRRRHSFLWQEFVVTMAAEELKEKFIGTSNAYIAFKHDLEAIGTNAHELPMVLAALAMTDEALFKSQYDVLEQWKEVYDGALQVMLPDTFGTTQFLANAPEWVADYTGLRIDSKDPIVAGDEYINWLAGWGRDPKSKLIIPSDGLDITTKRRKVERRGDITQIYNYFDGRIRQGFGMGTLLTNDFRDCHPRGLDILDPISIVCKVSHVWVNGDWKATCKLSDNPEKASGAEAPRYRRVFGVTGFENSATIV